MFLASILRSCRWTVYEATDLHEAVALLREQSVRVVIVEGDWRTMLDHTSLCSAPPSVIVTAPFADEALWAEVLNLGGFDVLAQPFDATEVSRIAHAAMRWADVLNLSPLRLANAAVPAV